MNRRTFQLTALAGGLGIISGASAQVPAPAKIKAAQIGTRHAHASGQLDTLRKCPDFDVIGVFEPDEARRKRLEKDAAYAGLPWMSLDELLSAPGLQMVSVETEVSELLNYGEKVVNAGHHLHMDKPAGQSLPQFKRLLETATAKKKLVKMGYMFRYNPAFEFVVNAVNEGWLGEVFSIHAEMSKAVGEGERKSLAQYPGGSMFELGCHLIDSVVRIMGSPQKVTPYIQHSRDDGFADNMTAVLEYPRAIVTLKSAMIEVNGGARRQFVVAGSEGTCEIRPLEPPSLKLSLARAQGEYKAGSQDVTLPKAPRYLADWFAFAKAIRGEMDWEFTPEHDLAVQETVLRAGGLIK